MVARSATTVVANVHFLCSVDFYRTAIYMYVRVYFRGVPGGAFAPSWAEIAPPLRN